MPCATGGVGCTTLTVGQRGKRSVPQTRVSMALPALLRVNPPEGATPLPADVCPESQVQRAPGRRRGGKGGERVGLGEWRTRAPRRAIPSRRRWTTRTGREFPRVASRRRRRSAHRGLVQKMMLSCEAWWSWGISGTRSLGGFLAGQTTRSATDGRGYNPSCRRLTRVTRHPLSFTTCQKPALFCVSSLHPPYIITSSALLSQLAASFSALPRAVPSSPPSSAPTFASLPHLYPHILLRSPFSRLSIPTCLLSSLVSSPLSSHLFNRPTPLSLFFSLLSPLCLLASASGSPSPSPAPCRALTSRSHLSLSQLALHSRSRSRNLLIARSLPCSLLAGVHLAYSPHALRETGIEWTAQCGAAPTHRDLPPKRHCRFPLSAHC